MIPANITRIIPILFLAGCATDGGPTRLEYREVAIRTVVPCVPASLPPEPQGLETRATLAAVEDPAERYVRLARDWAARAGRMAQTEPVLAACR